MAARRGGSARGVLRTASPGIAGRRRARPQVRRAIAALLVLAACTSGAGGPSEDDDPLATIPTTTTRPEGVAGSGYRAPVLLGLLGDPDLTESSGLVASRRNAGLYWSHNDSGDGPLIYCIQGAGEPCGVWRVTGATARDWEDIDAGPGPEPTTSYLYIAEIGDNMEDQPDISVFRVPEPAAAAGAVGLPKAAPGATEPAQRFRLRYPDGPHNAEALMVHPQTGDVYIVVKAPDPGVYVARAPLDPSSITTMRKVATLPLGRNGTFSLITGGSISPDGMRVALCDYAMGYELRLPAGAADFDEVWQQPPQRLSLALRPQGESIAYRLDGKALLTTSERPRGLPAALEQIEQR